MKRIRVPEGMLSAAYEVSRVQKQDTTIEEILEAALLWLSEHPQVPTDEQIEAIHRDANPTAGPARGKYWEIRNWLVEWQRRCFVQEEPEIAEIDATIPDLLFDAPTNVVINEANRHIREAYRRGLRKGEQK